ncbi:MAG: PQQ-binding-like beta-propeller repeat protein [Lentisphaerae bacterium]|nr:PQQ-binding-like beta-propeller repeat protein [Lentisphaerota bacterium]
MSAPRVPTVLRRCLVSGLLSIVSVASATGPDWPQYRADGARLGYTPEELPGELTLDWVRAPRHAPHRAWVGRLLSPSRMHFDWCYTPVVAGGRVFFGSSADHQIHALDAATGKEIWRFFTGGPVRFAPAIWRERLFAVSDDGCLYCLDARTGDLLWSMQAGPGPERMIGNGRLVSRWAARGGPAIRDGVVYFAAGPWPVEGVYVYAVECASGRVVWCNDVSGDYEIEHPHMFSVGRGSVGAQGYLAVSRDNVLVSTGRSTPAVYDRETGRLEHFHLSRYGGKTPWGVGGGDTVAIGDVYYNGGFVFDLATGLRYSAVGRDDRWNAFSIKGHKYHGQFLDGPRRNLVVTPAGLLHYHGSELHGGTLTTKTHVARREAQVLKYARELTHVGKVQAKGNAAKYHKERIDEAPFVKTMWTVDTGVEATAMIAAGSVAYLGTDKRVMAFDTASRKLVWSRPVDGVVRALAAADGRLFAAVDIGAVYCFSAKGKGTVLRPRPERSPYSDASPLARFAVEILRRTGISKGYCLDAACGDGELAFHLARLSDLYVVAVSASADEARLAREKLDAAGIYGTRVTVLEGPVSESLFPPHFANLIVSQASFAEGTAIETGFLMPHLSPERGRLCGLRNGVLEAVSRPPLEGAGSWTHSLGDSGNSLCSDDELVSGPLGILWYEDEWMLTIDRHGKNPAPLYADGVMIRVGLDAVKAVDAYNGTELWKRQVSGLLRDYRGGSAVGAVAMGSICCIENGALYLRHENHCLVLDLQTGEQRAKHPAPLRPDGKLGTWGYLAVEHGILIGTLANEEHAVKGQHGNGGEAVQDPMHRHFTESIFLFAMDAANGTVIWTQPARDSIRNNAVALGNGRVYFIDREPAAMDRLLKTEVAARRRGGKPVPTHAPGLLVCLEAENGRELWRTEDDVFGTTLGLSKKHDLLVMSYNKVGRSLPSDGHSKRARCYRGATGERAWDVDKIWARPVLNDQIMYCFRGAFDLLTGEQRPLKPGVAPDAPSAVWSVLGKGIGCGTPLGSRNMLFVRSGAVGYYDITHNSGWMETYGGIRSGCWLNAIPVGGIVLMPDDTRACRCSFPNQASIALYRRHTRPPDVRPTHGQTNWRYTQRLSRSELDFTGVLRLTILPPGDGSYELRYTLDGTAPDETSPLYSEALSIEKTTVVSAAAYSDGIRRSLRLGVNCVAVEKLADDDGGKASRKSPRKREAKEKR